MTNKQRIQLLPSLNKWIGIQPYFRSHVESSKMGKRELFTVCSGATTSLDRIKWRKKNPLPPPPPLTPKTQGRNYTKAKKTRIEQRTSTGSEVLFVKLALPNLFFLVSFYRSRMTKIHFRLTWAAQKRLCLSYLICVCREGRERKGKGGLHFSIYLTHD